jgi:hypothetical protein
MKTNITLISQSRDLFGITVRQETKTGFLNLSDLQDAYDNAKAVHGWSEKRVNEIISYSDNKERIFYILERQGFIKTSLNVFIEQVKEKGITKVLKSIGAYKTTGARTTKSVVCNPYIWVLIAMEMNPMLYAEVVTWLTDRLIINRIEAGDMYKDLSKAVAKFPNTDYSNLAKAINYIVFGRHEAGIRNTGTEEQLKELRTIESNLAFSIDAGFIKSFPELMNHIRNMWTKKNQLNAVLQ